MFNRATICDENESKLEGLRVYRRFLITSCSTTHYRITHNGVENKAAFTLAHCGFSPINKWIRAKRAINDININSFVLHKTARFIFIPCGIRVQQSKKKWNEKTFVFFWPKTRFICFFYMLNRQCCKWLDSFKIDLSCHIIFSALQIITTTKKCSHSQENRAHFFRAKDHRLVCKIA